MGKERPQDETREMKAEENIAEVTPEGQPGQGPQRIRLNFEGITPQYANFCTLNIREGEIFLNFGKAFVPAKELKVDSQIIMSMSNFQRLYDAMGRLLEQQRQQKE